MRGRNFHRTWDREISVRGGPKQYIEDVQHPLVDGVVLSVPRHDDSNPTSSNVSEPDVESPELVSDDDEHSVRLSRVLDLWQEFWGKPERQCDLGRLVEVCLQHVPTTGSVTRTQAAGEQINAKRTY